MPSKAAHGLLMPSMSSSLEKALANKANIAVVAPHIHEQELTMDS
jgi:hypothetical protein